MVAKAEAEADRLLTEAREEIEQNRAQTEARLAEQSAAVRGGGRASSASGPTSRSAAELEAARQRGRGAAGPGPRAVPGHGRRGPGPPGPGAGRPVPAPEGAPRPDRAAPRRPRAAGRDGPGRPPSVDAIAEDLFAAEDNARLAAEAAGREAAGPARRGHTRGAGRRCCWPRRPRPQRPRSPWSTEAPAVVGRRPGRRDRGRRRTPEPPSRSRTDGRRAGDRVDRSMPSSPRSGPPDEAEPEPSRTAEPTPPTRAGRRRATGRPTASADGGCRAGGRRRRGDSGRPGRRADDDEDDEDDGPPPEERNPLAVRRDELIGPDRDRPGPTAEADPAGQPERTARQPAVQRVRTGRSSCFPTRPSTSTRYATAALPALEQAAAGRRRRSPGRRAPPGPGPTCWWGSPTTWPRRWSGRCAAGWPTTERPGRGRGVGGGRARRARRSGSGRASGSSDWPGTTWWRPSPPAPSPPPVAETAPAGVGGGGRLGGRALPRLRGQRPERVPAARRGVPHRAPASTGPPRVSMPARALRHLGCCRASPQ